MSNYTANPTEQMACPNCGALMEGKINEFITPAQIEEGAAALCECPYCESEIMLTSLLDGRIKVSM